MRTSTAAWAAALAVMSMCGPFTTAEPAPARRADQERPRPIYPKLKKRQGFNDTTESRDPDPLGVPSVLPILGGSSAPARADPSPSSDPSRSDPDPDPIGSILGQPESSSSSFPPSIPLTSSASLPASSSPADSSNPPQPSSSQANLANPFLSSFLSSLLHPTGDSGFSLAPSRSQPSGSFVPDTQSHSSSEAASSTEHPDNDPLLGSITGALSNAIPPTPSGMASSSGAIIVGITTVLHQSLSSSDQLRPNFKGTGNPGAESTTQSDNGILPSGLSDIPTGTGNLGSVLPKITGPASLPGWLSSVKSDLTPHVPSGITGSSGSGLPMITGTGGIPGVLSSMNSDGSPVVPSGVSGLGTGITGTATLDSIASNPSPIVTLTGGTGDAFSTPTSAVFTITREGTSVIVSVPPNTGGTSGASPVVTAPPASASTTSSSNESDTVASATETTNSSQASPSSLSTHSTTATTNDTVPVASKSSAPSTSVVPTPPSSVKPSTVPPSAFTPQVSIVPTGTDSQTSMTIPQVWSFAPSSSRKRDQGSDGIATAASATLSSSGGFPTTMPRLVQPAGGMPDAPANFTLVQVGFNFGLNYPFVVSKPESATQIFAYLPQGIAYGLGISKENVLMNALMPYDTSQSLGYITTLAQTYIPSDLATQLQLNLHAPTSPIYFNPSDPVKTLMDMVNPTIPILPGAAMDGLSSSSSYNPAATTRAGEGDGAPIGGDSGSSKKITGTSVGIGAGAIAGAAVYAAAMVYVARRYRQKRKGHQRASSVPTAGEMTQRSSGGMGGLFMSGANGRTSPRGSASNSGGRGSRTSNGSSNGRSVREQGISAPLMSENSLGWN